jgi:hypothetical protein
MTIVKMTGQKKRPHKIIRGDAFKFENNRLNEVIKIRKRGIVFHSVFNFFDRFCEGRTV